MNTILVRPHHCDKHKEPYSGIFGLPSFIETRANRWLKPCAGGGGYQTVAPTWLANFVESAAKDPDPELIWRVFQVLTNNTQIRVGQADGRKLGPHNRQLAWHGQLFILANQQTCYSQNAYSSCPVHNGLSWDHHWPGRYGRVAIKNATSRYAEVCDIERERRVVLPQWYLALVRQQNPVGGGAGQLFLSPELLACERNPTLVERARTLSALGVPMLAAVQQVAGEFIVNLPPEKRHAYRAHPLLSQPLTL